MGSENPPEGPEIYDQLMGLVAIGDHVREISGWGGGDCGWSDVPTGWVDVLGCGSMKDG